MPVMQCQGTPRCERLVSASAVPGGNPAALDDPEGFAVVWTRCPHCGAYTCDRCHARQGGRCRCGQPVRMLSDAERRAEASAQRQAAPLPTRRATATDALPALTSFDPPRRLALWVAMGFLRLAASDGKVTDAEVDALARTFRAAALPDVIREVGLEPLTAMASSDDFETLTRELRALPTLPRRRLVELLRGFASADGRADPREEAFVASVARALEVSSTPTASR